MLLPCRHCARHVRPSERRCPFCAGPSPSRGLELGPTPSPSLSRAAQLAFYVTLGIAAVRCVEQPAPAARAPAPAPRETLDAADAATAPADAAPDAFERRAVVAIYGATTVMILEAIGFALESDAIAENGRTTLDAVAELMKQHPFVVEIQGHADVREKRAAISLARAERVKKALVALGIAPERLRVRDRGTTSPVAPPGDSRNARVGFQIAEADGG